MPEGVIWNCNRKAALWKDRSDAEQTVAVSVGRFSARGPSRVKECLSGRG